MGSSKNAQTGHTTESHSGDYLDDLTSQQKRSISNVRESERLINGQHGPHGTAKRMSGDASSRSDTGHLMDKGDAGAIPKYPFLLLNLIMILRSASERIYSTLMDQYMYQRYANDILGNVSQKTASQPCVNDSNTSDNSATNQIQDMTSQLSLYISLADYGLAVVPSLLLGAYSALFSRKVLLFIPTFVGAVKTVVIAAVVYWNLDLNWLFLGYSIDGLGGGLAGSILGIFLYLTDITSRGEQRTVFMSFLEGLKGVVSGILFYVTGKMIESTGFLVPVLIAAVCMVLSSVIVLLLPERKSQCASKDWSAAACYKRLALPFGKSQHPLVRKMVILSLVSLLVIICAALGVSKVRNLYLMNVPFCWDAVTIGWFLSAQDIAYNFVTMVCVPLFYRCLPGMWLAILGTVSTMAGMAMYALANSSLEIYTIIGLSIGSNIAFGLIRGEASRLLDRESQGSLFATLSVFESVSFLCGTPMLLLYKATVGLYSGFTFLAMDGLLVVAFILLCIYQVLWNRYTKEIMCKEFKVNEYGSINS
ncbi:hypothetical protein Btru_043334 [Bulinus truncatus]|nr:hypothetical protein Btru_043334 [Bulinus truncatus]